MEQLIILTSNSNHLLYWLLIVTIKRNPHLSKADYFLNEFELAIWPTSIEYCKMFTQKSLILKSNIFIDDIVKAVTFAKDHQLPLTVASSRHDFLGRSSERETHTFNINLIRMKDRKVISNDPDNGNKYTITVQTGNDWQEIYKHVSITINNTIIFAL